MDSTQIRDTIRRTLSYLDERGKYSGPSAVALVHRTAIVESLNFEYLKQKGAGPAKGFWQIELATAIDLLGRYLVRPSKARLRDEIKYATGINLWYDDGGEVILAQGTIPYIPHYLETNIALGIVLCRLRYWTQPGSGPIPHDIQGQAEYWKRWYNTPGGGGTVEHFVDLVGRYGG